MSRREPNRGYFLAPPRRRATIAVASELGREPRSRSPHSYFRIADDRLRGELPDRFTEALAAPPLRPDAGPAAGRADAHRRRRLGAQKKPGYGWEFSAMLTTPDSLLQSYRLRLALEPAALLEPGYRLEQGGARALPRRRAAAARGRHRDRHAPTSCTTAACASTSRWSKARGNPFFIDTMRRVNRVRRLLSYRSMRDRIALQGALRAAPAPARPARARAQRRGGRGDARAPRQHPAQPRPHQRHPRQPQPAMTYSADIVRAFAPTGRLRASINLGNPILAEPDAPAASRAGVSVDLARGFARAPRRRARAGGVRHRRQVGRRRDRRAGRHRLLRDRSGARRRHRASPPPYVLIEGCYLVREGSPLAANDEVDRAGTRGRGRPGQRLRPVPHARAEAGDDRARADLARGGRALPAPSGPTWPPA